MPWRPASRAGFRTPASDVTQLRGKAVRSARASQRSRSPANGQTSRRRTPMTTTISRRTLIAGAFAAPAILTFARGAQAATNLTLGHDAAPGNPRSIAAERFAELVKERVRRPHHRSRRRLRAARQRAVAAHQPAHRRPRHDRQQPGRHLGARAGARGARPALPVRGQRRRLQGAGRPDRRGAGAALRQGRDGAARLVGQRHPPHHQQQAADQQARRPARASRSARRRIR